MGKTFKLIAVTAHHIRAQVLAQVARSVLSVFQWSNWQQMALLVRHTLVSNPRSRQARGPSPRSLRSCWSQGPAGLRRPHHFEHHGGGITRPGARLLRRQVRQFSWLLPWFPGEPGFRIRLVPLPSVFFGPTGALFSTLRNQVRTIKKVEAPIFYVAERPFFATLTGADASIGPQPEPIFMRREK